MGAEGGRPVTGIPRRPAPAPSRVDPTLVQVELALERAEHVVVDRPLGPQPEAGLALRVDHGALALPVLDGLGARPARAAAPRAPSGGRRCRASGRGAAGGPATPGRARRAGAWPRRSSAGARRPPPRAARGRGPAGGG